MQAGHGHQANLRTFSLTELSYLMKILDEIHVTGEAYNNSTSLKRLLIRKGSDVLIGNGLYVNDRIGHDLQQKLGGVCTLIGTSVVSLPWKLKGVNWH